MSSLYRRRIRRPASAAIGLAGVLLLTASVPVSVATAQAEASEQGQKLAELRDLNADAERKAAELRGQMEELQAEAIDRGVLMTLDEAAFTTNNTTLSSSGHRRMNALADFLKQHPERSVAIDGYAGAADFRYDQALSKRRADAVKAYLIRQNIPARRLTARGNAEALNREDVVIEQRSTRRVEVIIEDVLSPVSQSDVTGQGTIQP